MIEDRTVRNLSPATPRSCAHAVAKFGGFFGRSPERLGLEEVRTFQVHLVAGGISWPELNQTVCALRFLYGVTLKQADLPERIPYAQTPRDLSGILGTDEVVRFLEGIPSVKARAALTTAYAADCQTALLQSSPGVARRRRSAGRLACQAASNSSRSLRNSTASVRAEAPRPEARSTMRTSPRMSRVRFKAEA